MSLLIENIIRETARSFPVDKKYTHFAVRKSDNKIVTGWDYKGLEPDEIKHYVKGDLKDMFPGEKLGNYTLLTGKSLISKGINPFDWNNWKNDRLEQESLQETEFKNPKDLDIAGKVRNIFAQSGNTPMSQLAICQALGFDKYDMRATMVFRAMVISQEMLVDKSAKPMKLYLNAEYKAGATAPLNVPAKVPIEKKPTSNKAKMDLAEKIKSDLNNFRPGSSYMKGDPEIQTHGGSITIGKDFRDLGIWESDYENSYDKEEGWDEDDDNMIWKDARKYEKMWKEWVKSRDWAKFVKEASVSTSEKSWCEFYVTLK